jgi:hypothetical protein
LVGGQVLAKAYQMPRWAKTIGADMSLGVFPGSSNRGSAEGRLVRNLDSYKASARKLG